MIFFHGTSEKNGREIEKTGFKTGLKNNWKVKGKPGFVYFSTAYAPFYAMACKNNPSRKMALIKVEIEEEYLYPEDDFIMNALGKPKYTTKDLEGVSLKRYKYLWENSLRFMGNVAAKPCKVKVLGVTYFDGKRLLMKCDPVIAPINFKLLGDYYKGLTEWIYEGKNLEEYKTEAQYFQERSEIVKVVG